MPSWVQWFIGLAAAVTAFSVLWTRVVKPLDTLISWLHDVLPVMSELTEQFKDSPTLLKILKEIAAQFHSDGGSSLRDVVNRLDEASKKQELAASDLRVKAQVLEENVKAVQTLSRDDRTEASHRLAKLDEILSKLGVKVNDSSV